MQLLSSHPHVWTGELIRRQAARTLNSCGVWLQEQELKAVDDVLTLPQY